MTLEHYIIDTDMLTIIITMILFIIIIIGNDRPYQPLKVMTILMTNTMTDQTGRTILCNADNPIS